MRSAPRSCVGIRLGRSAAAVDGRDDPEEDDGRNDEERRSISLLAPTPVFASHSLMDGSGGEPEAASPRQESNPRHLHYK